MKEKLKSYYHKFINYFKSNWIKVLCIFIVVVYLLCGIVSIYKNNSSSNENDLKNDTTLPIPSTYKVINKKELIQEEPATPVGSNEFNHSMVHFFNDNCSLIRTFDNTSLSVTTSEGGSFWFDIDFSNSKKKFITFNWHNPDQLLIQFLYNGSVIAELDEFIVDYSYSFYFSSRDIANEPTTLKCIIFPSFKNQDASVQSVSFWNIGIYDLTSYYDKVFDLGNDNGYENGYDVGFDAGEKAGHDTGYQEGYDEGELVGGEHGYQQGYNQGHKEGKNEGLTEGEQKGYTNGFNSGKEEGLHEGERKGYNDGLTAGRELGYKNGYDEGYSAGSSVVQVKDVFIDILEAPFNILKNAFNFEILGINFSSILVGIVSILLVAFVIRKVI